MISTDFDFFSAKVRISVKQDVDAESLNFFYSDFKTDITDTPDIEIFFHERENKGVIENLLINPDFKYASYRLKDSPEIKNWDSTATIIPPFLLPPLKGRYLLLHGAAITKENGRCALILAEHYQGKTTLTLSMIVAKKFQYLTEDLIIMEQGTGKVHPINKPAGVRYKTVPLIPGLKDYLNNTKKKKEYVSNITGPISTIKINHLIDGSYCSDIKLPKVLIFPKAVGSEREIPVLKKLNKNETLKRLMVHRFNADLDLTTEMKELLYLVRDTEAYQLEYNLQSKESLEKACEEIERVYHDV